MTQLTQKVITVSGRKWLLGMEWSTLEFAPDKDELLAEASSGNPSIPNRNWVAVRNGTSAIQAGYCQPVAGFKTPKNIFSLAAMLADSKEQPWLGIFRITPKDAPPAQQLWWYVAVRDAHAILPDGDVVGTETEIMHLRAKHASMSGWKYFDGDIDTLAMMIAEVERKPTKVKNITESGLGQFSTPQIVVSVGLSVAVAAGGGGWLWYQHQQQQALEQKLARDKILAQLNQPKRVVATVVNVDPAYARSAPPDVWLGHCSDVLIPTRVSWDGWIISGVSCEQSSVTRMWVRGTGATVEQRPPGQLSADGNSVTESVSLNLKVQEKPLLPGKLDESRQQLFAWAQRRGIAVSFVESAKEVTLPGAVAAETQQSPAPRSGFSFSVISVFGPSFAEDMATISGLRLTNISSTKSGWNVQGVIYGKRD